MLRYSIFLTLSIALLCFTACVHNRDDINTVTLLQKKNDSLLASTSNISIDSINNIVESIKEKMLFFKRMDSLLKNTKHQSIVSEWSYLYKYFDKKKQTYFSILNDLELSKKQLRDLNDDIKNNALKEEKLKEFIAQETRYVNMNNNKMKYFTKEFDNKIKKYYSLLPQINAITDSITNTKTP